MNDREQMHIVICGHVDHGKSTIIGRLLADTDSLPEGKLAQVQDTCARHSKPFEYAFLLDALKDEQAQGITIDAARVFFKTQKRDYLIIDAPGHIEFLKNMITGASHAEVAALVIDAKEGVRENSRRHGYMISMLGIKQLVVLVNKMDLVEYKESVFKSIVKEYTRFLKGINVKATTFIPVSGMSGDMIAERKDNMQWYRGSTFFEMLDDFTKESLPIDKPFRMPVQGVYKFTNFNDDRRIIAGTVETGTVTVGDEVVFYPSGKRSTVKSIEHFNGVKQEAVVAGMATGFTVAEQIYITRGEVATRAQEERPQVTSQMCVHIFWMGKEPLTQKKNYILKVGTARVSMKVEEICRVINASTLHIDQKGEQVNRHEVAECIVKLNKAIAFDRASDIGNLGRFVIVDECEICGGGIVQEALEDQQSSIRDAVFLRNYKWEKSMIPLERRAEKYSQKAALVILSGGHAVDKKSLAKALETKLFEEGKVVYFLGIGSVLYGVDADLQHQHKETREIHAEHIRRLAEIAHIVLDAGVILIVTATALKQDDLEIIKTCVSGDQMHTVWIGELAGTDISADLNLQQCDDAQLMIDKIKELLQKRGVIFKPW